MTERNEISEKALWRLVLLAMLAAILLGRRVTAAEQRIQPQLDRLLLRAGQCLTAVQQYCGRCLREFPRCSPADLAQAGAAMAALAADVERLHQLASVPVCCPADAPVAEYQVFYGCARLLDGEFSGLPEPAQRAFLQALMEGAGTALSRFPADGSVPDCSQLFIGFSEFRRCLFA